MTSVPYRHFLFSLFMLLFVGCGGGDGPSVPEQTIFPALELLSSSDELYIGNDIVVSAENSYVSGAEISRYEWRVLVGDNRHYEINESTEILTHKIEKIGLYRIELKVFDQNGSSETATLIIGDTTYRERDFGCVSDNLSVEEDLKGIACANFANGHAFASGMAMNDSGQIVSTWQSNGGSLYDIYFTFFDGSSWSAITYIETNQCCGNGTRVVLDNSGRSAFVYYSSDFEDGKPHMAYFNQHEFVYDIDLPGSILDLFIDNMGIVTILTYGSDEYINVTRANEQGVIETKQIYVSDFIEYSRGDNAKLMGHKESGNVAIIYTQLLIRIVDGEFIYTPLPSVNAEDRELYNTTNLSINSNGDVDVLPDYLDNSRGFDWHYRFYLDGSFDTYDISGARTKVATKPVDPNGLAYIGDCLLETETSLTCPEPGYWLTVFNGQYWQATHKYQDRPVINFNSEKISRLFVMNNEWVYIHRDQNRHLIADVFEQGLLNKSIRWPISLLSESSPSYRLNATGKFAFAGMLGASQGNEYSGYSIAVVQIED